MPPHGIGADPLGITCKLPHRIRKTNVCSCFGNSDKRKAANDHYHRNGDQQLDEAKTEFTVSRLGIHGSVVDVHCLSGGDNLGPGDPAVELYTMSVPSLRNEKTAQMT